MIHTGQLLSPAECEELLAVPRILQLAKLTGRGVVPDVRLVQDGDVCAPWFDDVLHKYIKNVLVPLYSIPQNYGVTLSFLEYKTGCFFKRHTDFIRYAPRRRLVSLSVGLDSGYTGGELTLYTEPELNYTSSVGSIIAFPSDTLHEVKPITSGTRHAIVVWISVPNEEYRHDGYGQQSLP